MKKLFTILIFIIFPVLLFAQDSGAAKKAKDSVALMQANISKKDSIKPVHSDSSTPTGKDSLKNFGKTNDSAQKAIASKPRVVNDSLRRKTAVKDSAALALANARINDSINKLKQDSIKEAKGRAAKNINPVQLMHGEERTAGNTDLIFYILIFLVFFLSLVKTAFPKYVNSIFSLSFQATFRQTQTREQMEQNFFPAFMLNVLFVLCGGLFITLFAGINGWTKLPFWELFIYSTAILLAVYFIKYLVISFTGWVFNAREAAAEYRFVVFLINKLLAILLLPLLFLIAYSNSKVQSISITIVICLAVLALIIRYLISLSRIRKNLHVTAFHFFIYLCAVEIIPLLVIYKILFLQTSDR